VQVVPPIGVFGRGAVALTIAILLRSAGFEVIVTPNGPRRISLLRSGRVESVEVERADMLPSDVRLVIVGVKGFQMPDTLSKLSSETDRQRTCLLLQNGLPFSEQKSPALRLLPSSFDGTASVLDDQSVILHAGGSLLIDVQQLIDAGLAREAAALEHSRMLVRMHMSDIVDWQFKKLALACTGARMALAALTIRDAFNSPQIYADMTSIIQEATDILLVDSVTPSSAKAKLIALAHDFCVGSDRRKPASSAWPNAYTSLHHDLDRRRGQSEVEFLNGYIVQRAKSLGMASELNTLLCDEIRKLSTLRVTPAEASRDEELQSRLQTAFARYRFQRHIYASN